MAHTHMLPLALLALLLAPGALSSPSCALTPPTAHAARAAAAPPVVPVNASAGTVVASAWFPGWLGADYTPANVSWDKYNAMTYAFAVTTPDASVISLAASNEPQLAQFVAMAHENDVKALVSVGGWTGSQYFSTALATPANRTLFVDAVLGLVSQYSLDGIDFDWEYPGKQGIGCNTISPADSANFLAFLQALRAAPGGGNITVTAAVGLAPFAGPDGTPLADVSAYAAVIDYIEIMAYDVWGAWSTGGVGPNAPLNDTCAPAPAGSAASAVTAWTAAGFPAAQIALGVAAYGHSFRVAPAAAADGGALAAYPPFDAAAQPAGDKWDGAPGVDQCGNAVAQGGIFDFWGLVDGGFLDAQGAAAPGVEYRFDNCSETPYVYNATSEVMVSYDDATSFAAKGKFIDAAGLRGFAMWHVAGDFNDILLDSISDALGIEQDCE